MNTTYYYLYVKTKNTHTHTHTHTHTNEWNKTERLIDIEDKLVVTSGEREEQRGKIGVCY